MTAGTARILFRFYFA